MRLRVVGVCGRGADEAGAFSESLKTVSSISIRLILAGMASLACHAVWLMPLREQGLAPAVGPRLNARVAVQAPKLEVAAREASAARLPELPVPVPPPETEVLRKGEAMPLLNTPAAKRTEEPTQQSDFLPRRQPDQPARLLSVIEFDAPRLPPGEVFAVAFHIEVTREGRARKVELAGSGLDPELTQLIMAQLQAASYRPAMQSGVAVDSVLEGGFAPLPEAGQKAEKPELTRD